MFGMDMQTVVAGLTGILRWNRNQLDSQLQRLVSQEDSQLVKRPRVRSTAFCLVPGFGIRAFSDSFQVFDCNSKSLCFGVPNNAVADRVIQPRLESSLLSRQPLRVRRLPTEGNPDSSTGLTVSEVADIYADYFSCLSRLFVGVAFSSLHNDL